MIKVRIVKNQAANIERDINEALMRIGGEPGFSVRLEDIKLIEAGGPGMLTAMIIYSRSPVRDGNAPQAPGAYPGQTRS